MPIPTSIRNWIIDHDYKWLFVISYVTLAVVLSIAISLFWLVVVVAVHALLEIIRQYYLQPNMRLVVLQALWEVKLDIALVLFALALSLYMDVVLGVLGIRSVAQLGGGISQGAIRGGARIAAWQRVLRGVLLSLDDLVQVLRAIRRSIFRRSENAEIKNVLPPIKETIEESLDKISEQKSKDLATVHSVNWGDWSGRWGIGDWLSIGLGVACIALMVLAPLTTMSYSEMYNTLVVELHPYPQIMSAD